MKIVKKLSMKQLVGGRPIPNEDGSVKWLASVVGIAVGIKTGVSNFGEWTALMGNFAAQQEGVENPERMRTGQLFLPDVALFLITPAIQANKGAEIQFGFKIGIVRDDNAATGYVYTCESLIDPQENDPLEMLMKKSLPALPKLPAPTKPATPAAK